MRVAAPILALFFLSLPARADDAPKRERVRPRFSAALFEAYTHQQQMLRYVFNDQDSKRITQSSQAKRLQFEWRWRPTSGLLCGFQFPTRDETLRSGEDIIDRHHFPKVVWVGTSWDPLVYPLSERGDFELGLLGGVEVPLAERITKNLSPYAEADLRITLKSGSALQLGFKYAGIATRGNVALVLGVAQRL